MKMYFPENNACLPACSALLRLISLYAAIDLLMHLMPRELGKCISQG